MLAARIVNNLLPSSSGVAATAAREEVPRSVVVVDNHRLFREVVIKLCVSVLGLAVVGEADSVAVAATLIEQARPDLLVLDPSLPDACGLTLIRKLPLVFQATRVLLFAAVCDQYLLHRLRLLTVHGFLLKGGATLATTAEAIQRVLRGERYFCDEYSRLMSFYYSHGRGIMKMLSDREIAMLSLIGDGLSDEEAARVLRVARRTAQTHRSNLLRKLNIDSTPKLMRFAIEQGFADGKAAIESPPRSLV